MDRVWSRLKKTVVTLGAGGCIGFLLIFLVYMLPVDRMRANAAASLELFDKWDWNPQIISGYDATTVDTYTDAWMMRIAIYDGNESVLQKCMSNFYYGYDNEAIADGPCESLAAYVNGVQGYQSYSYGRYWHGYLVILKPLLLFFDYGDIIGILKYVQLALVVFCCVLLDRKKLTSCIPCLLAMLACIESATIGMSMQFSWVFLIAMISVICCLRIKDTDYYAFSVELLFLITGMCTSYMDFLTYPLFTLGVPLTVMLVQRSTAAEKGKLFAATLLDSAYWALGYLGVWFIKWVLCTVITDENVILDALYTVMYRMSDGTLEEEIGVWDIWKENLFVIGKWPYLLAFVCAAAWLLLVGRGKLSRPSVKTTLSYLFVILLPFVWYACVRQHSYVHSFMVFRDLGISVFGTLCFLMQLRGNTTPVNEVKKVL